MSLKQRAIASIPAALIVASPAAAQVGESLVVQTPIPQNYDRGRNVSVTSLFRPDYAALGERVGSFILYPRLETGGGGTSNAYYDHDNAVAAPFIYVTPSAKLVSDWARHLLTLSGTGTFREYAGQSRRNEQQWKFSGLGQIEISKALTVQAQAEASQALENLFSGEVTSSVAALSHYRRNFYSLQTTYTSGRGRAFLLADYANLQFASVPLAGGGMLNQSDRNRKIARITGQVEYATSPSISLFAQLSGSQIRYDRDLIGGGPKLNSDAARFLVGGNIDISGRIRGSVGIGYSIRNYESDAYSTVRGLSIESNLQLFPLRRLTITINAERTIEDASLSRSSYWNTQFGSKIDYEVLRNFIASTAINYSRQSYLGTSTAGNTYGGVLSGQYFGSRRISLLGSISYSLRSSSTAQVLGSVTEARIQVGLAYQL